MTEVSVPTVNPTIIFKKIGTWIAEIVQTCHKEAAFIMGLLVAFGVTPAPATGSKWASAILLGYAGVTHAAEKLGIKLPSIGGASNPPSPIPVQKAA